MKPLQFGKGGSSSPSIQTAQSIYGTDNVEVILGICQGPIKGLANGPKSFLLDDTPLVDADGTQNFKSLTLDTYAGDPTGDYIVSMLGGAASPTIVNQVLTTGSPVVRSGAQDFVNAVDYRITINNLSMINSKGNFKNTLTLKFEWKRVSDVGWTPAWASGTFAGDYTGDTPGTGAPQSFTIAGADTSYVSFEGDRELIYTSGSTPSASPINVNLPATTITSANNVYLWDPAGHTWSLATKTTISTNHWTYPDGSATRDFYYFDNPPPNALVGALWRKTGSSQLLFWNAAAWVTGDSPLIKALPAAALDNGIWQITEQVTSAVTRNIRIYIPKLEEKIQLRVTKITAADVTVGATQTYADCTWESFIEVKLGPLTFYNVALAHLFGQATDQFTTLPVWNGIWDGKLIKVPANYDEVARTYSGVWDGTYKIAFTNNAAFVFQDFVENDVYGLSSLYPHTCNKYKIYEWGQNNDVMVARIDSTLRPRWTYNDLVDQPRDAREMAQFIAGSASAVYVDDGNGNVDILIDKNYDPVALFTKENVGEEGFEYSYTDRQSRANEITVSFINPDLNWVEDKRVVRNTDDIATYGRIPLPFIAAGCTDLDEAMARARRKLITNLTEKEFVTFSTNRKGNYLTEWTTILVSDPDMGYGISGRVSSILSSTSLKVRDAITFEAGFVYVANFDIVNPAYGSTSTDPYITVQRTITNGAGSATTLTFSSALPTLAEYAVFSIQADGLLGFPKPYKITNIDKQTGDPDRVVITALEVNRNKQTYIDGAVDSGVPVYSNLTNTKVLPVTGLKVNVRIDMQGGVAIRTLVLSWLASASQFIRDYTIAHSIGGAVGDTTTTDQLLVEYKNAAIDIHTFSVVANDINGRQSTAVSISFDVAGEVRSGTGVQSLVLLDGTDTLVSDSTDPKFAWDPPLAIDPNFSYYQVRILDSGTSAVRRTENVGQAQNWIYTWAKQLADDAGTPTRRFTIEVTPVDQFGGLSAASSLDINNPAPAVPGAATLTATIGGFNVVIPVTTERDVTGVLLWVSGTTGFDPTSVAPLYDAVQGNTFYVPNLAGTTKYVRAAFYDPYGKAAADLHISAEQSITAHLIVPGDLTGASSTAVPTGLALSSSIALDTDGSQVVTLIADWDDNTEASLVGYDVAVQEASGNFVVFRVGTSNWSGHVKANVAYTVKVRSVDALSRSSSYDTPVVLTTGKDTTAPGAPSSVATLIGIGSIYLSWFNPSDADLVRVGVYENTTNVSGTATLVATVNALPSVGGRWSRTGIGTGVTRYYWLKAFDSSGNASAFSTGVTGTTAQVLSGDIAVDTVLANNIVANITTTNVLNANVLLSATSLPASLIIGSTGFSLSTVNTVVGDPAAKVNSNSTKINPGLVLVSGSTTLSDWRNSGDNTKIEGGSIATNTIQANTVVIGTRGINIEGLQFEFNSPSTNHVSWTAGTISYVNDAGTATTAAITADNATFSGSTIYIYWTKGGTTLASTTTLATAMGSNAVILASYMGTTNLVANYGRTVIDGGAIKATSIAAAQMSANSITAANGAIQDLTVGTLKIIDGSVTNGNSSSSNSTITVAAGSPTTLQSCSLTTNGGVVQAAFSVYVGPITIPTGGDTTTEYTALDLVLYRDATRLRTVRSQIAINLGTNFLIPGGLQCFLFRDTGASAASHTYAVQAEVSWTTTSMVFLTQDMQLLETKK